MGPIDLQQSLEIIKTQRASLTRELQDLAVNHELLIGNHNALVLSYAELETKNRLLDEEVKTLKAALKDSAVSAPVVPAPAVPAEARA